MSNMIRKSLDPNNEHLSPLNQGEMHQTFEGLKVNLLYYPDEPSFKQMVYKATMATRGSDIDSDEYDEQVVVEAFSGGLNQCLEWVTVVFEISGVSRGLTHELVRTRKASFAQQSMRHTNMGAQPNMRMPREIADDEAAADRWADAIRYVVEAYDDFVNAMDLPFQDARTVLPIATETYIIASYPLSVFLGTYAYRACYMFYPEIVELFHQMREELLAWCPWLEPFVKISCEKTRPNEIPMVDEQSIKHPHMCTYQGWERVEGHCPFSWAKEDNRVWKSSKFEN